VNVDNALLAAEVALTLGLEVPEIVAAFAHVSPAPGRFQVLSAPGVAGSTVAGSTVAGSTVAGSTVAGSTVAGSTVAGSTVAASTVAASTVAGSTLPGSREGSPPFTVVVDYAHTPAGLEVVLREARGLAAAGGRVLVAFGCGGNRDREKRPKMGRAASLLSDVTVLTSDNPRDEDPLAIIEEVRAGVVAEAPRDSVFRVEPDRQAAIALVLGEARAGDVVVIAGKGHEDYQEIGGVRLPFDDVVEARRALSARFPADPSTWVAASSAETTPEGE
jgi:UDP-N-acetylmuramyl tripeptide synthase